MEQVLGLSIGDYTNPAFWWQLIVFCLIAYLIGSLNFGNIISIYKKKSLRTVGSGNFGATNAGRAFGSKGFLFVFFGDFIKPLIATLIIVSLAGSPKIGYQGVMTKGDVVFSLFFCLIGHTYPIYFKFNGGKGVATALGLFFILNWYIGLITITLFGLFIFFTRRVAASSVLMVLVGSILLTLQGLIPKGNAFYYASLPSFSFTLGVLFFGWFTFVFVIYNHRRNIQKILRKEEPYVAGVKELHEAMIDGTSKFASYLFLDKFVDWFWRKYGVDDKIQIPSKARNFKKPEAFDKEKSETKLIIKNDDQTNKKKQNK